ncbi:MAG: glycosyltransferase [Acidimicrobiales bacterium]
MRRVLKVDIGDVERELIIVESNSTDGTREIVESFRGEPGVTIVLEDRPSGKGHAVRTGLRCVTGDVILIQDGDLEYDVDDYPRCCSRWPTGGPRSCSAPATSKGKPMRACRQTP